MYFLISGVTISLLIFIDSCDNYFGVIYIIYSSTIPFKKLPSICE